MERIIEPELMESEDQSQAYAAADFSESNSNFVNLLFAKFGESRIGKEVLDLGCGDGEIVVRLARRCHNCRITGLDGSAAMLRHANQRLLVEPGLASRVRFVQDVLPGQIILANGFDVIISNSLLHHLHDPGLLWHSILRHAAPRAVVFVMDLLRPDSPRESESIVSKYAGQAPEVLRRDFFNSLNAAFTLDEVKAQLKTARLQGFAVEQISDRHFIAYGTL